MEMCGRLGENRRRGSAAGAWQARPERERAREAADNGELAMAAVSVRGGAGGLTPPERQRGRRRLAREGGVGVGVSW